MSPHRAALMLLAVFALVLQACGPATPAASTASPTSVPAPTEKPTGPLDPDPDAPARLAQALRGPFSEASVSAVIEALARAGIAVYADDGATVVQAAAEPASGLRYLKFQARGMAMELAGRGGFSGARLNELIEPLPLPDGSELAVSALLGVYVAEGDSFGAQLSRQLLGGAVEPEQHAELVYPTLSLALFVREVALPMLGAAGAAQQARAKFSGDLAPAPVARQGDPCGAVNDFLDDLPDATEQATRGALGGDDDGLWGFVVGGAARLIGAVTYAGTAAVRSLIRNNPVINAMRAAADMLAALADLQSMFSQWTVTIQPSAGSLHKSVSGPVSGSFTLTLENGGQPTEWPPQVSSCAELFAIDLPQLNSADGATVTWIETGGFPDLAVKTGADAAVAGSTAAFNFVTVSEDQDIHADGEENSGGASVQADIALPGLEDLAARLARAAGGVVAQTVVNAGSGAAAQALGPTGSGSLEVTYHQPAPAMADLDVGQYHLHAVSCEGVYGLWTGTITFTNYSGASGSTDVQWQFDRGTNTAPFNWSARPTGVVGPAEITIEFTSTETLTLNEAYISSSGSYVAVTTVKSPGGAVSTTTSGKRDEDYPITRGPQPECN